MVRLARYQRFSTEDQEEFAVAIARLLNRRVEFLKGRKQFHFAAHTAKLELLTINAVESVDGLTIHQTTLGYSLARIEAGGLERRVDGHEYIVRPGAGYLTTPPQEAKMTLLPSGGTVTSVTIELPEPLIKWEAELLAGGPIAKPLEIVAPLDLRPSTHLGQMTEYLLTELDREHNVFETAPLVGLEFQRRLIASVIEQTPNNYHSLLGRHFGGNAQRHVTMAAEFIEAHLHGPLTIGDIAHAIGISVRTLQDSCHRLYDMPPEELLRKMRLHVTRKRLMNPEPGDTVNAVARKYGFTNPGRFSYHYRREFLGESPAETLQRGRRRLRLDLMPPEDNR